MAHFEGKKCQNLGGHSSCCDNCCNRLVCVISMCQFLITPFVVRLKSNSVEVDEAEPEVSARDYGKEAKLLLGLIRVPQLIYYVASSFGSKIVVGHVLLGGALGSLCTKYVTIGFPL